MRRKTIYDTLSKEVFTVEHGEREWSGEESDDRGKIVITENIVRELHGKIVYS